MIEIVTHVYAEKLPQYAVFLRAQLTSLLENSGDIKYRVAVCYCPTDAKTRSVVDYFAGKMPMREVRLQKNLLFRRSIGRNLVAKSTDARLVWFTDVDHVFGPGCLESVAREWDRLKQEKETGGGRLAMVWPRQVYVTSTHEGADEWWRFHMDTFGECHVNGMTFDPKNNTRAIGGIQIVNGDIAREIGYLDGRKRYQTPVDPEIPFPSFRDDVVFRKTIMAQGAWGVIDAQNLYRIRHSAVTYK